MGRETANRRWRKYEKNGRSQQFLSETIEPDDLSASLACDTVDTGAQYTPVQMYTLRRPNMKCGRAVDAVALRNTSRWSRNIYFGLMLNVAMAGHILSPMYGLITRIIVRHTSACAHHFGRTHNCAISAWPFKKHWRINQSAAISSSCEGMLENAYESGISMRLKRTCSGVSRSLFIRTAVGNGPVLPRSLSH